MTMCSRFEHLSQSIVTNAFELVIEPTMEHEDDEGQLKDVELCVKKDLALTTYPNKVMEIVEQVIHSKIVTTRKIKWNDN